MKAAVSMPSGATTALPDVDHRQPPPPSPSRHCHRSALALHAPVALQERGDPFIVRFAVEFGQQVIGLHLVVFSPPAPGSVVHIR